MTECTRKCSFRVIFENGQREEEDGGLIGVMKENIGGYRTVPGKTTLNTYVVQKSPLVSNYTTRVV